MSFPANNLTNQLWGIGPNTTLRVHQKLMQLHVFKAFVAPGVRTYVVKRIASSRINASRYIVFQNMFAIRDFVPFKAKIRAASIGLH